MAFISKAAQMSGEEIGARVMLQPATDEQGERRDRVCGVLGKVRHWRDDDGKVWTRARFDVLGGHVVVTVPGETGAHIVVD